MEYVPWGIAALVVLFTLKILYDTRIEATNIVIRSGFELSKLEKSNNTYKEMLGELLYKEGMRDYKHFNY